MAQKKVITCDICGKEHKGNGEKIYVQESHGHQGHPYSYEDVCQECLHKISVLIRENLKPVKYKP